MIQRIADLRSGIQTLDAARILFDELAQRTLKLAAHDAAFEKKVAKMKAEHHADTAADREYISDAGAALAQFITARQDLFQDPRKIKTSLGSFGLQAVSELLIENQDRLERHLMEDGLTDCFIRSFSFVKKAIKKRLEAGEKMPGARIVDGDVAVYKVEKTLVEKAKQAAV